MNQSIFTAKSGLIALIAVFCVQTTLPAQQGNRTTPRSPQSSAATNRGEKAKVPADDADDRPAGAIRQTSGGAPKGTAPRTAPSRPKVPEPTPELEAVLKKWEQESSKIKSLHGTQSRSEFNPIFEQEKVSRGPFFLEMPDKGRIDLLEVKVKDGAKSRRTRKKDGEPWELISAPAQRWICAGDSILMIDEEDKTYKRDMIPEEQRGKNIVNSPLPFLFGTKADDLKRRFDMELRSNTAEAATILAYPKLTMDQENYRVARITLDKKRYVPNEVRMLDDNNFEVVYTFESVVINDNGFRSQVQKMFSLANSDPYHPNLKGYKVVVPIEDPIAERERLQDQQMKGRHPIGGTKLPIDQDETRSRGTSNAARVRTTENGKPDTIRR